MHNPDAPQSGKFGARPDAAFDSFDEDAREPGIQAPSEGPTGTPDEHGHPQIPTTYAPSTGRRMGLIAGSLAVVLLVGFFLVNHARNNESSDLREDATSRVSAAPPVEFVRVK